MSLFDDPITANLPEGLVYTPDLLTIDQEQALIGWIDSQPWMNDLARRVQHYGWRYDYRSRRVFPHDHLGPLPTQLQELAMILYEKSLLDPIPDQCIINEYLPGQGIAPHIDCEPCFGEQICMVSLLSEYPMDFENPRTGESCSVWLASRSACVIQGPARWDWTHGIAKRSSDPVEGGTRRKRARRVSITFRTITSLG